jgi:hypothetical protein
MDGHSFQHDGLTFLRDPFRHRLAAIFLINIPMGLAVMAAIYIFLPLDRRPSQTP